MFDRLSNDVSGFGPNHREDSDAGLSESARKRIEQESCITTGFDFYVRNDVMINRERELFSPPFKTRAEASQ